MPTQTETNINAQTIVDKLRVGNLNAFLEFNQYITKKYNTRDPEKLMCYGTWELLSTDLNDSDITIAKLFNYGLDDNPCFLEEYALKNGSAELLNAAQAALILKQKADLSHLMDKVNFEEVAKVIETYKQDIRSLDEYNDMGTEETLPKEKNVVKNSFDIFELKYLLTEYKKFLDYDKTTKNNIIEERKKFVTGALQILDSELSTDVKNNLFIDTKKIISEAASNDPKELTFLDHFKFFFMKIFYKKAYIELMDKRSDAEEFCEYKKRFKETIIDPREQLEHNLISDAKTVSDAGPSTRQ